MSIWKSKVKKTAIVKCRECRYTTPDLYISEDGWIAYECKKVESPYYGCLLNVTADGDKLHRIIWTGCEFGKEYEYDR